MDPGSGYTKTQAKYDNYGRRLHPLFCSLKEQTEAKFNGIQEILKVSLAFLQIALLIYSYVT